MYENNQEKSKHYNKTLPGLQEENLQVAREIENNQELVTFYFYTVYSRINLMYNLNNLLLVKLYIKG